MSQVKPSTLEEILRALEQVRAEVATYFSGLPGDVFFEGNDERWSPGHHLKHLVLSNTPVAYALALPHEKLKTWNTNQPRRPYTEIRASYHAALTKGVRASGRFLPQAQSTQPEAVAEYNGSVELLNHDCLVWEESELDQYAVPHPVLGLLSMREMLFFTVYHNQHHLNGVQAGLERL